MAMKTRPLTESEQTAQVNLKRIWGEKARCLGLTQQLLADSWECTQGYVSNMISGHAPITPVYAMMFAKALQVDARLIHPDLEDLAGAMASGSWGSAEAETLVELYRAASVQAKRAAVMVLYADVEHDDDGEFIQGLLSDSILVSDKRREPPRGPGDQTPG